MPAIGPGSWTGAPGNSTVSLSVAFSGQVPKVVEAMTNAFSVQGIETKLLSSGFNTITLPANAKGGGVLVVLPAGNTATMTIKGVTGDTGVVCGKLGWCILQLDTTAANTFGLTVSADIAGVVFIWF